MLVEIEFLIMNMRNSWLLNVAENYKNWQVSYNNHSSYTVIVEFK